MKRISLLVPALVAAAALAAVMTTAACGGDDDAASAVADAGGGDTSSSDPVPGTDPSSDTDSGAPVGDPDGGTTDGSMNRPRGADGAVVADGGVDPDGAGPGGDLGRIRCGAADCQLPEEACCVYDTNQGYAYACVVGSTCPPLQGNPYFNAMKCSGAANCPEGMRCCANSSTGKVFSTCKATCGNGEAQLCDLRADGGGGCPPGGGNVCSRNNVDDWSLPRDPRAYGTCGGR